MTNRRKTVISSRIDSSLMALSYIHTIWFCWWNVFCASFIQSEKTFILRAYFVNTWTKIRSHNVLRKWSAKWKFIEWHKCNAVSILSIVPFHLENSTEPIITLPKFLNNFTHVRNFNDVFRFFFFVFYQFYTMQSTCTFFIS